jgi:hypothetical protein
MVLEPSRRWLSSDGRARAGAWRSASVRTRFRGPSGAQRGGGATSSGVPTATTAAFPAGPAHRRGESVRPVTHATAARVEAQWAELTSPEELEELRSSPLRLLTELRPN